MIEQLFGSKTRVKLLQLFYSNPNRSFYVREITRKIDEQINSVRRELANLLSIGLISSDTNNNRLYYEVNQKYEFYPPLAAIFGGGTMTAVPKKVAAGTTATATEAPVPVVVPTVSEDVKAIQAVGNVEIALLTGWFTRDETAGIDMLIVGDINQTKLNKLVEEMEAKEGKDIRFASMTVDEYDYRMQVNDRFLNTLKTSKQQVLIDKSGRLNKGQAKKTASDDAKTEKTKKE